MAWADRKSPRPIRRKARAASTATVREALVGFGQDEALVVFAQPSQRLRSTSQTRMPSSSRAPRTSSGEVIRAMPRSLPEDVLAAHRVHEVFDGPRPEESLPRLK